MVNCGTEAISSAGGMTVSQAQLARNVAAQSDLAHVEDPRPYAHSDLQRSDEFLQLRPIRCIYAARRRPGPARERTAKGRYSMICLTPPCSGCCKKSTMKAYAT